MTIARPVAFGLWLVAGLLLSLLLLTTARAQNVVPARVANGDARPAPPILLSVEVVPDKDEQPAAPTEPCDPRVARCEPSPAAPDTAKAPAQ
jgi:hypothetical protein